MVFELPNRRVWFVWYCLNYDVSVYLFVIICRIGAEVPGLQPMTQQVAVKPLGTMRPLYRDRRFATLQRTLFIYLINKYISLSDICLTVHH